MGRVLSCGLDVFVSGTAAPLSSPHLSIDEKVMRMAAGRRGRLGAAVLGRRIGDILRGGISAAFGISGSGCGGTAATGATD